MMRFFIMFPASYRGYLATDIAVNTNMCARLAFSKYFAM